MNFNYYIDVLKKYAVFSGRARRAEYWTFVLINFIVVLVLEIPVIGSGMNSDSPALSFVFACIAGLYGLGTVLPALGVIIRRLHDTGKSGWYYLWILVPIIGAIIVLIALVTDSQPGDNQYGPNPKEAASTLEVL